MSRLPKSLHSPWLPVGKVYETDRFPRRMDWKTLHMDRKLFRSGLKTIRMKLGKTDADLETVGVDEETVRWD